jgi:hypothetical protein
MPVLMHKINMAPRTGRLVYQHTESQLRDRKTHRDLIKFYEELQVQLDDRYGLTERPLDCAVAAISVSRPNKAAWLPLTNTLLIKYSQGFARQSPVGVLNDGDSKAAEGKKVSLENYTNTQFVF